MPSPPRLQYGISYHIFNRGNNRENIFIEERNYRYFLRLYARHVTPVANTFAYCLLRNHFHLAVGIKTKEQVRAAYQASDQTKILTPSRAFSNFFNAYAKAVNKAYGRTGSLFQNPFRRIPIEDDGYFQRLIIYIHRNPQRHGLAPDFRDWPYSSFQGLLQESGEDLAREFVLDVFGNRIRFIEAHENIDLNPVEPLSFIRYDWT